MPASKSSANNVLGKDFKGLSSKEIADAQTMNSGGNNQSDADDLLVEECSSDSKESGSTEEGDQLVNQVSDHVGLQKCRCLSSDRTLA